MKHVALAAALATAIPATTLADTSAQPVMDPVFITQNATAMNDDLLAPLLFVAFVLAAVAAGASGAVVISDARLKTGITRVGTADNGLPLYHFRYLGQSQVWEGVMAQDVLAHTPEAVSEMGGYYLVDYGRLGLEMRAVD